MDRLERFIVMLEKEIEDSHFDEHDDEFIVGVRRGLEKALSLANKAMENG